MSGLERDVPVVGEGKRSDVISGTVKRSRRCNEKLFEM